VAGQECVHRCPDPLLKRARVGGLGPRGELAGLAADQHYHGHDGDDRGAAEDHIDRS